MIPECRMKVLHRAFKVVQIGTSLVSSEPGAGVVSAILKGSAQSLAVLLKLA